MYKKCRRRWPRHTSNHCPLNRGEVNIPKISIITPSLNTGRFLRETVESILQQSFKDYEHIIVDGGSTDETLDILKEYPHIKWVSEKETSSTSIVDAFRRAFTMSQGEYIIQCCISDGFLDKDWFKKCVEILDADSEVSLVWGCPRYMLEDGTLGKISYIEFFEGSPLQKQNCFSYWLATGFFYPEGNYCVRREIFDVCFPNSNSDQDSRLHPALWFVYNFNTLGYLSYFLPVIANYGRLHQASRQQRLKNVEGPIANRYYQSTRSYRKRFLDGKVKHFFRNGRMEILSDVSPNELPVYKKEIWRHRFASSEIFRTDLFTMYKKCRQYGLKKFLALVTEKLLRF